MTTDASAAATPPSGQQTTLPAISQNFAIVGDRIQIGNKLFRVKKGGEVVTETAMLNVIHSFLDKLYTPQQFEEAFGKLVVQGQAAPQVKIVLTHEGAKVSRAAPSGVSLPSGQAVDVACKPTVKVKTGNIMDVYRHKFGKVDKELTDHFTYATKLQQELSSKGYSKEDVQAAIDKILNEGHLSLL